MRHGQGCPEQEAQIQPCSSRSTTAWITRMPSSESLRQGR
jgi:hypothetical protein